MNKIDLLQEAISKGDKHLASELCIDLYNHLRDFSQCIDVIEVDGEINIKMNEYTNGQRTKYLKREIQKWVGGH